VARLLISAVLMALPVDGDPEVVVAGFWLTASRRVVGRESSGGFAAAAARVPFNEEE